MWRTIVLLWTIFIFKLNEANTITWSKSYSLTAILTVPGANLTEPYQVWVDGEQKKSRVDFYNGMDKTYREWDNLRETYVYYKIHPENTKSYTNKDVCDIHTAPTYEMKVYDLNTYLPNKSFKYKHDEVLNGVNVQKWEYYYLADSKLRTSVTYTLWVDRKSDNSKSPVPVKFVYEMKVGDNVLDYFRHDYTSYSDINPAISNVSKPLDLICSSVVYAVNSDMVPVDPLLEYVEPELERSRIEDIFNRFKDSFYKIYDNEYEHVTRMNVFKNNLRFINHMNKQNKSYTLGITHLADRSEEEMKVYMGTLQTISDIADGNDEFDDIDYNDIMAITEDQNERLYFDWRDYAAVTPVKDQTSLCGSCYAFATSAVVESAAYVARGCRDMEELSEQALLDCTWNVGSGNLGCQGGTFENTLIWVKEKGLPPKAEYGSYLALEGRCHIQNMTDAVKISHFGQLLKKKHVIKETLRKKGPLVAAINTFPRSFGLYTGGIYEDPECRNEPHLRTHAVTLIGYGKEEGKEYWTLKNTFGRGWGEAGYMRLSVQDNVCGLKNFVYSVDFKDSERANCKPLQ